MTEDIEFRWPHPACLPTSDLIRHCEFKRTKAGGPGGQHRNKVETAIVVIHLPTGIQAQASERRSQHANREVAVQRLRVQLAIHFRIEIVERRKSDLWNRRLRGTQIQVSAAHEDFAGLLAEALDWTSHFEFQVSSAAEHLGCSTSQLIKLIKKETLAITMLNREREARGLSHLK